jgi:hypothetical protein
MGSNPLLLAPGKLVGLVVHPVDQTHSLQRLGGQLARIELAAAAVVEQQQFHVLQGRGAGQEVEDLEDEADDPAVGCGRRLR